MSQTHTPYDDLRKVVAATDYSELSDIALIAAIEDAFRQKGMLHVVHVTEPALAGEVRDEVEGKSGPLEELRSHVATRLLAHAELHDLANPVGAVCHLRSGDAGREIAQLASDVEADVVFVSTHGRTGFRRMVLGSVAERVIRYAPCPVMVMRVNAKDIDGWEQPDDSRDVTISPPCPKCIAKRRATGGAALWCEEHEHGLGRRHTYHFEPRGVREHINPPLVFSEDTR